MPWLAEDSAQGHACPCAESRFSAFTDLVAACFDQCISRSTISTLPQEIVAPTDAIVNWQFLQSKPRTPRLDSRHCAERPDLCAWIHQGLFARIYVSAQFAPISQKNQLGCLIMCCTSVCRGISIQCRWPRPYLAESLAECRAATDLQVTCVWLSFPQKAQSHGLPASASPSPVACWFKLGLWRRVRGGFPQILCLGVPAQPWRPCQLASRLSAVELWTSGWPQQELDTSQTGIAEAAHLGYIASAEREFHASAM
jgi:hypothetical protein